MNFLSQICVWLIKLAVETEVHAKSVMANANALEIILGLTAVYWTNVQLYNVTMAARVTPGQALVRARWISLVQHALHLWDVLLHVPMMESSMLQHA
jgi:hypothetical protein